ncbi:MAG: type I pullulanase [Ruminococcus sp.]|nr:type I pullulanase [Ruminococcus sp.]
MRTTKKFISTVLAVCMLASTSALVGSAAVDSSSSVGADTPYSNACQALDDEYAYSGNDLGATYAKDKTVFKVWSPTATEVKVNLYKTGSDSEAGAEDLGTTSLVKDETDGKWNGVWTVTLEGDYKNVYYTYTITAAPTTGGAAVTRETQDIYSVAVGVNGNRSMICDLDSTDPEGWENDTHVLRDNVAESNVWELHIKDFSYDKASGVSDANRGKYLAFTEEGTTLNGEGNIATCIDYLKELGINTVQINPFYDFQTVVENGSDTQFNWGYDPKNYNVPEGSYSSNPYDGNVRIKECKQMIQALHNAGISVVMDVVYNHTYATTSSFEYTVPNYYYRKTSSNAFSNGSGCGNETASERAMFRNFMIQSCRYWVDEYHIDGFRFDLMGLHDVETMNLIRDNLDEVDTRITTWGEGWTGGTSTYPKNTCSGGRFYQATQANAKRLSTRVGFFNDAIRDGIKGSVFNGTEPGFVQGTAASAKAVIAGINANSVTKSGWQSQAPSQCVSYDACHDNATLYDKLILTTGLADYGVRQKDVVRMNKLAAAILYTSQGATFQLAGEEMCRTKYGDTNSYKSSPEINKINWQNVVDYADVISYYNGLSQIRTNFTPFTCDNTTYANSYVINDVNANSAEIAFTIANDQANEWSKLAVLYNGNCVATDITLADTSTTDWVIIANDITAGFESLGEVTGSTFTVPANSAIIAVEKSSFESVNIKPAKEMGKVKVNYVYENNNEPLDDSVIITGTVGSGYQTVSSVGVPDTYVVSKVEGDEIGKFEAGTKEVTYYYVDYVPESVKNADINGDGKITIDDATAIQKYLADLEDLSDDKIALLDINYDGSKSVDDVTMLQKYLAGLPVSSGTVTVNYLYPDAKGNYKKLTDSVVFTGRAGSEYNAEIFKVVGYAVDESADQPDTTGLIPYGSKEINFYYSASSLDIKLHVAHSGSSTWVPSIWLWGSDLAGKDTSNFTKSGTWPGDKLTDEDGDGWYDYEFTYKGAGSYNVIISNNGSPQSADYKGCVDNEMWIVIDDAATASTGSVQLLFYLDNPFTNPNAPVASNVHPA